MKILYLDKVNFNKLHTHLEARVLFVDMNSFFASCEQQTNYWLRGRPVAVCVYTGKYGCVIAPSIEAKLKGIKLGLRLNEAIKICPDLVPLETNPEKYRSFHVKVMNVLKKYSNEVIPKSIDEAIVDLSTYKKIHPDPIAVALAIKKDISEQVGDWLKCSIGIAPNAFLAKLASDIQKPDGLTIINPQNIDEVLGKLELTDLPGIAKAMAARLMKAGIYTPLQLRHSKPEVLKAACKSIIGLHWYYRLHFQEVDMLSTDEYKSMSAMRQVSKEQREDVETLKEIMMMLCLTLEKRLVSKELYCKYVQFYVNYDDKTSWGDKFHTNQPLQDGMEIFHILQERQQKFEEQHNALLPVINKHVTSIGLVVTEFINEMQALQLNIFDNTHIKNNKLRKAVYDIKNKYGKSTILRASELKEDEFTHDIIGFGNIKDL